MKVCYPWHYTLSLAPLPGGSTARVTFSRNGADRTQYLAGPNEANCPSLWDSRQGYCRCYDYCGVVCNVVCLDVYQVDLHLRGAFRVFPLHDHCLNFSTTNE